MKIFFKKKNKVLAQALETERFILQPLTRWQAFRLTYPWTRDAELIRTLTHSGAPRTRWKWFREMDRPNNRKKFSYAIIPHGTNEPIGMHTVVLSGYKSARMAVAIHDREWWGKDVVLEVRAKLINHFFDKGGLERFFGSVLARNIPSVFNYRKLGFKHVGTLRRMQQDPVSGEVFDLCMFELFRDEWEQSPWATNDK